MSVRRFNYTQRRRIRHGDVAISLNRDGDAASFQTQLNLSAYELPADARVVVEAYRQTALRRYNFGLVRRPHAEDPTDLSGLPEPSVLLFRVKVVDPADGSGKLLAEADRIRPSDPEGGDRPSFISVSEENLNGELWRLAFIDDAPVLQLEKRYGPREVLLSSPHFKWLILPELFRALLREGLSSDIDDEDSQNSDTWQSKIIAQGRTLSGEDAPDDPENSEDAEDWIASAVSAFCRKHGFAQRYRSEVFPGTDS